MSKACAVCEWSMPKGHPGRICRDCISNLPDTDQGGALKEARMRMTREELDALERRYNAHAARIFAESNGEYGWTGETRNIWRPGAAERN